MVHGDDNFGTRSADQVHGTYGREKKKGQQIVASEKEIGAAYKLRMVSQAKDSPPIPCSESAKLANECKNQQKKRLERAKAIRIQRTKGENNTHLDQFPGNNP